jgi:hypothetical protein
VYGLLGGLADKNGEAAKPSGEEAYWMEVTALQTEGRPVGFTTYRPSDLTGFYPIWREFAINVGDVDMPPIGIPMGPRHFSINARAPFPGGS